MEEIAQIVEESLSKGQKYFERNGQIFKIRDYELTIILKPDLSDANEKELIEQIKSQIRKNLGKINYEEEPKLRLFAYNIGKYDRGKYYYVEYSGIAEPEITFLKLNPGVIRYLLVLKEPIETKGHIWRRKVKESLAK